MMGEIQNPAYHLDVTLCLFIWVVVLWQETYHRAILKIDWGDLWCLFKQDLEIVNIQEFKYLNIIDINSL